MINSVSAVSFKSSVQSAQASADPLSRPGAFSKPEAENVKEEAAPAKKGGFLKGLAKVVAAAIIVGGGLLIGVKKGGLKVLNKVELKDAKFMKKVGHYFAKAGTWVDEKIWQKLPGVAKKAKETAKDAAKDAAETVAEGAEKVATAAE